MVIGTRLFDRPPEPEPVGNLAGHGSAVKISFPTNGCYHII
jgi:hypothetical protein